jgi:hypothetical protein
VSVDPKWFTIQPGAAPTKIAENTARVDSTQSPQDDWKDRAVSGLNRTGTATIWIGPSSSVTDVSGSTNRGWPWEPSEPLEDDELEPGEAIYAFLPASAVAAQEIVVTLSGRISG